MSNINYELKRFALAEEKVKNELREIYRNRVFKEAKICPDCGSDMKEQYVKNHIRSFNKLVCPNSTSPHPHKELMYNEKFYK